MVEVSSSAVSIAIHPISIFLFYCVCDFTPACDFDLEISEEEKALSKSKISAPV